MKFFGKKTSEDDDAPGADALREAAESEARDGGPQFAEGEISGERDRPGFLGRIFRRNRKSGGDAAAPGADPEAETDGQDTPSRDLGETVWDEGAGEMVLEPEETETAAKPGILGRIRRRKSSGGDGDADGDTAQGQTGSAAKKSSGGGLKALFSKKAAKTSAGGSGTGDLEEIVTGELADYEFDGAQTLKIAKKHVVLGMLWDSSRSGVSPKKQAAEVSSDNVTYNLVAPFREADQIGFAEGSRAIKPGYKAGVTAFSERRMGSSWVAAFRIGDNADVWWVAAKRNGQVYEDQVFTDEDEARMVFLENLEAPDWQRRIAPEDWDLGGCDPFKIQDVIEPAVGIGLKPVNPLKTYMPRIIVAGVLAALAIGAYVYYQGYQETLREREAELKRQREQSVRVSPSDYPWFDAPDVVTFIEGCIPAMEDAIRDVPGWTQSVISCRLVDEAKSGFIHTSWSNSGGTVPWMIAAFAPDEIQPQIDAAGTAAAYRNQVEYDVETDELDEPLEADRISFLLTRRIQTMGVDVNVTPTVQRVTPEQRARMKKPVFNYHEIGFQTSAGMDEYVRLFSDMPATVPMDVVYDLNSRVWNVTFRIYHTPIMPL